MPRNAPDDDSTCTYARPLRAALPNGDASDVRKRENGGAGSIWSTGASPSDPCQGSGPLSDAAVPDMPAKTIAEPPSRLKISCELVPIEPTGAPMTGRRLVDIVAAESNASGKISIPRTAPARGTYERKL